MLSDTDTRTLKRSHADAAAKVAALPNRIRDEEQQAEAENREPGIIEPLTGISAGLLLKAIEEIEDAPADLSEIIGVQRRACRDLGNRQVYLLSEQLLAILTAAGIGGVNEKV
jgi:hypothetical protein